VSNTEIVIVLIVAVIGALATVGGPVLLLLLQRTRKESADFREENSKQHGETLSVIREIHLMSRETRQDVRELRTDVDVLKIDFEEHKSDSSASGKVTKTRTRAKQDT